MLNSVIQPEVLKHIAYRYQAIAWRGVTLLSEAVPHLSQHVLLHAGPPYQGEIPLPVKNAAAQAIMYEGAAKTIEEANTLLDNHSFVLRPAQDYSVVTPLAQVVSYSMPVSCVALGDQCMYAPFAESGAPALRFGNIVSDAIQKIQYLTQLANTVINPYLSTNPVAMHQIIEHGLLQHEECHALVSGANTALIQKIPRLSSKDCTLLSANPNFVLPLLMASSALLLKQQSSGIVAVGGNGETFGWKLQGDSTWKTVKATPPVGKLFKVCPEEQLLPAIGDSAVVDFAGLGGQLLMNAPQLQNDWQPALPDQWQTIREQVIDSASGLVSYAKMQKSRIMPLVNLAILDASGEMGLVGRGVYQPSLTLLDR